MSEAPSKVEVQPYLWDHAGGAVHRAVTDIGHAAHYLTITKHVFSKRYRLPTNAKTPHYTVSRILSTNTDKGDFLFTRTRLGWYALA